MVCQFLTSVSVFILLENEFTANCFLPYLSLEQHATHFDGEIQAMTTALIQIFDRTGSFEKTVTFSDSP
jgi:hypothetical protein